MKAEDVRIAREVLCRVEAHEEREKIFLYSLLWCSTKDARGILEGAKLYLGELDWIMAGLNCSKNEDVAPIALMDFFSTVDAIDERLEAFCER